MKKIKLFREFIENNDNIIDIKMQELKDLIDGMSDQSIVYEWENKSDHEVVVNFTYNDLSIRYEFDVDQMYVAKFVGDTTDFQTDVESIDEGLDVIEKDIQGILGISENKDMLYLKKFESYSFEDFTHVDMDDVKDLLEEGLTAEQIAIELDFSLDKVKQIVDSIEKNSYMTDLSNETFESLIIEGENVPTNSSLWSQCKSWAKSKYDVWPSAYACGAAAKRYKSKGGKWKKRKNKKK
jgi:DNA-binding NarL/FixJ family response regulator